MGRVKAMVSVDRHFQKIPLDDAKSISAHKKTPSVQTSVPTTKATLKEIGAQSTFELIG